MKYKGVIFDMDNTLLRSKIDFPGMKLEIHRFLVDLGVAAPTQSLGNVTTSMLMAGD
jgi:phosphoglycolate phosphatase